MRRAIATVVWGGLGIGSTLAVAYTAETRMDWPDALALALLFGLFVSVGVLPPIFRVWDQEAAKRRHPGNRAIRSWENQVLDDAAYTAAHETDLRGMP